MSSSTKWSPVTQLERKEWLLANGEVVSEPDLEESPSGRKVRIVGTDMSAFRKDMDALLQQGVVQVAKDRGTRVWMPLSKDGFWRTVGIDVPGADGNLHVISDPINETILWWSFRHAELPIEATVVVRVHARNGYYYRSQPWSAETALVMPSTGLDEIGVQASPVLELSETFQNLRNVASLDYNGRTKLDELIRDHPPTWPTNKIGRVAENDQRRIVKYVLEMSRVFEEIDSIQVPDLRNPEKPGWMTLELFNTNYRAGFEQDCLDVLDGQATVEEALAAYKEFLGRMNSLGITIPDLGANHIAEALKGTKKALEIQLQNNVNNEGGMDDHHRLFAHLITGTLYVECDHKDVNRNEVAEKWEEAQTIASLTGNTDELLAYAREYVRRQRGRVVEDLIDGRTVSL